MAEPRLCELSWRQIVKGCVSSHTVCPNPPAKVGAFSWCILALVCYAGCAMPHSTLLAPYWPLRPQPLRGRQGLGPLVTLSINRPLIRFLRVSYFIFTG